jgi:TIR domain
MAPSSRAKNKLFLSHSATDRKFVVRLASILERSGLPYWYSASHILGAKQWHDEIGRALTQCNWFLVVLTPDSVRSQWVKRELLFALNEERYHERIIPLLYKKCKYSQLSWTLPEYEFVDFTGDFEAGCRQLLRIWKIELKPKSSAKSERKRRG